MNLNEITTVNDLMKSNEAEEVAMTADQLWEQILRQDAPSAMSLALQTLAQLGSWHQSCAERMAEEGNLENAQLWLKDEARIHMAYDILNGIEVG